MTANAARGFCAKNPRVATAHDMSEAEGTADTQLRSGTGIICQKLTKGARVITSCDKLAAAFDQGALFELEIVAKRQAQQEHEHEIGDSLRRRCRMDLPGDIDRPGAVLLEEHLDRRLEG